MPLSATWTLRGQRCHLGGDRARKGRDKVWFRRWQLSFTPRRGNQDVMVRCTNHKGDQQPMEANWNPSGFMRNVVETISLSAV